LRGGNGKEQNMKKKQPKHAAEKEKGPKKNLEIRARVSRKDEPELVSCLEKHIKENNRSRKDSVSLLVVKLLKEHYDI